MTDLEADMSSFGVVFRAPWGVAVTLGCLLLWPALALADEALIDYRKGVMRAVGGHLAATTAVVVDGVDQSARLAFHTGALVHLLTDVPDLFPEGSDFGETAALPSIWEQFATFTERSAASLEAAQALHVAVESGDVSEVSQRFRALGQSCRACHQDFRQRN
jgi:cytochrome c556